jgi:carbon-monoxide dehydrogenase large subunit
MACTPERVWRAIHSGGSGGQRVPEGTVAWAGDRTESTAGGATDADGAAR